MQNFPSVFPFIKKHAGGSFNRYLRPEQPLDSTMYFIIVFNSVEFPDTSDAYMLFAECEPFFTHTAIAGKKEIKNFPADFI